MSAPSGPGSLHRGIHILKLLATAGARGLALTEIAARSGLPHPSVHRVLRQLAAERLVERHGELKRWRLGPLAFELGVAASTRYDIRDVCDSAMRALAESTGDTVYLVLRSGFDAVCMHRIEGSFPIRTLVLEVGSRRPLGVGAGGLAILAALDGAERAAVIARVAPSLGAFGGLSAPALARACTIANERGMCLIEGTVNPGVSAIGHVLRDGMGQALAALSVAALAQRMTAQRLPALHAALRTACMQVGQRLRAPAAA